MDSTAPTILPVQRELFDIPDDVAYLNCAYMSPLLRSVVAAGERGVRGKAHPWEISPTDFFSLPEEVRELCARIINADANGVALVPAASYGLEVAAQCVESELSPGDRIIVVEDQFPSNIYTWRELAKRTGAEVHTVASPEDDDLTGAVLAVLDERVKVAALAHCRWTDGALMDLVTIGRRCREVGCRLALDLTQSGGALPFDAGAVGADFVVCAGYKWLLGPYSLGFLWVAPEHRGGEPLEYNWIARANSENFATLVDYRDDYQPGARRFDVGERSNFTLMPMLHASLSQLLDWGVANIAATLAARTGDIAERARALGLDSVPPALRAGHFLGLRFPGGVPEHLPKELAVRRVFVSVRGNSMRITPHLFNSDADVDRLFEALEANL